MAAKKILIADDDPDILTVLGKRFSSCGYEVVTAEDGEQACLKAKAERPDLIVLDVLMPKMSGYDALRRIREDESMRKIPVLVVSARGVMRNFFTDLSYVEFIGKPFDTQELLGKVQRALEGVSATVRQTSSLPSSMSAGVSTSTSGAGQQRAVVVLGVQDSLTDKIIATVSALGIEVERALNEEDACRTAQKIRPEKIFCQYWEDEKVLDAKKVADRFLKTPGLAAVSFYIYCEARSTLEAMKVFREDKIIGYQQASDLTAKIKDLLSAAV